MQNTVLTSPASVGAQLDNPAQPPSLLKRLTAGITGDSSAEPTEQLTTLYPLFGGSVNTLPDRRGLRQDRPGLLQRPEHFAVSSGFQFLEDRRKKGLAYRDERRRLVSVRMFAASLVNNAVVADGSSLNHQGHAVRVQSVWASRNDRGRRRAGTG